MPKLTKFVPKERPEIQDNIYTAKITKVEQKVWAADNISLSWTFELSQPPYLGQKVWVYGSTGTTPTPKARLVQWAIALGYTREQLADENFNTDVFVGSFVKVFVKTWEKESGGTKQGVTDLIPLTEADQQLLQIWLQQLQVTGPQKVAAAAPAVSSFPPVSAQPAPQPVQAQVAVAPQPEIPVAQQPLVATPAPAVVPVAAQPVAAAPRRKNDLPF